MRTDTSHMDRAAIGLIVLGLATVAVSLAVVAWLISPWMLPALAVWVALAYAIGWWLDS